MRHNHLKAQETPISLTSHGSLVINVYNETIASPIKDARVDIFGINNQGEELQIESLTTNAEGQTESIELSAPPKEFSMQPQDDVQPFTNYNIRISAPNFDPAAINNIEIFDTTTAIQSVNLAPQTASGTHLHEVTLDENTLWGDFPPKIPEAEVKELPPATGFVVLDEVVIPEFIVVHDGLPDNQAAPNYWIPFREYVKNVASSEIYSTWPRETLKANVLAILSFTLNRVFTEWYRGQGKSFTITSTTNFDQKFTYGRNIYQEISNVVDEIFTNYITRLGVMQPLFAQYCDGQRSHCPTWMSQWGSATMGERGSNYLEILRHYYGDIYIDKAKIVSGVPVSFPGHSLSVGSSGASVRTIQTQLNAISNNYPLIPKLRVDGIYGEQTANAVRVFQQVFKMPQSGVVDFATWYRISGIFVAVSKLATLI